MDRPKNATGPIYAGTRDARSRHPAPCAPSFPPRPPTTGDNLRGQLGVSNAQPVAAPQPIQAVGRWAALAISDTHAAGLTCDGHLYTWGANGRGQLGQGEGAAAAGAGAPARVAALADADVK
jgi:hypothetical protein